MSKRIGVGLLAFAVSVSLALAAAPDAGAQSTGLIDFDHYHTLAEIETYLEELAALRPDLVELSIIGRSREDRPIWAVDVNNPETGSAHEKAGFYVDGNIHGGEVLGGEGALAFLDRIVAGHGADEALTDLVDRRAFYVVPIVNPDGRAISVDTPENHRWNVRPVDEDGDGLVDEDPPEDLDGDGRMLRMRVRDADGPFAIDPAVPRRMIPARAAPPGAARYRTMTEGLDNDGDGRFNEDRVGGVDLNRNFPANWSAVQFASGPFPLSEPETHALVAYITDRPNIAAVHTFHTSGGLILRFPTLADQEWGFPEADLEVYRGIAEDGVEITGYANYAWEKRPIVDLMSPGHGVFNDWASKEFGVFAITTEMWAHAIGEGQDALFAWNDRVLDGTGFVDWYPFRHPELGPVELGGWDRWSTASPPPRLIADEVERNVRWVVTFAEKTPRITLATSVSSSEGVHRIRADVANVGWMPTATEHARALGLPIETTVTVELDNAELVDGAERLDLGILPGIRSGRVSPVGSTWRARVVDEGRPARVTFVAHAQKAGTVRATVELRR